MAPRGQGRQA